MAITDQINQGLARASSPGRTVRLVALFAAIAFLPTAAPGATPGSSCAVAAADRAWLDRAVHAWTFTALNLTHISLPPRFEARIFDAHCTLASRTAMAGGASAWVAARHGRTVILPNGETIPSGVISFAQSDGRTGFFVMSMPSVWRAGQVAGGPLGLESLMVAVLLHEGSHAAQIPTYGRRMETLSKHNHLPDSFSDDSIQERFEKDVEFGRSVERETELLLAAAETPSQGQALTLAGRARALMRQRHARWFRGPDAYLAQAEEIWLTMEGSGQWLGYRWLIDRRGGRFAPTLARKGFGSRGKWWSQKEGFALFMALDRLTDGAWTRHAFGDGSETGVEMLDAALLTRRADHALVRQTPEIPSPRRRQR